MEERQIIVTGEPIGKGRPRFNRKTGIVYTPSRTTRYEKTIKQSYIDKYGEESQIAGLVELDVKAYFKIPKSANKATRFKMQQNEIRPAKKPDCDNILKAVADALNGLAYEDDRQVIKASIEKFYTDNEEGYIEAYVKSKES